MAGSFPKDALKICVAQICQNIGWHAVQASPMDILVDVLQRYVLEIAKSVHQYSSQYNRTEPNLDDLALTFKDFGISLPEIEEYANNVEPVPFVHKVPQFPIRHPSNLQIPKPESRELLTRPEYIPDYFPLMRPDLEEEDAIFSQQNAVDGVKKTAADSNAGGESPSPFNSPKHGSKRSTDWTPDTPNKKARFYSEEEGRPMREVTSVFMTAAGFISPVHEGKTADASLPSLVDSPPPSPEYPSPSHSTAPSKKESKSKDIKKDKSSKPKKDKEGKKELKKVKSSKKEKENKENAVSKHDKTMTSSSSTSIKKEHSSHKSSKSDKSSKLDDARQKLKSDKAKLKARKEELHKVKESFKLMKLKAKMKHSGTSSSTSLKSSKLSSSKKFKSGRVSKPYKNFKSDKVKPAQSSPVKSLLPIPVIPKEPPVEIKAPIVEPIIEKQMKEDFIDREELNFREESPESRLVIDDSLETQARQEKESRLVVIDECIEAVIRRGEEESEVETEKTHKAMDETINAVVRGPAIKKLEPKDIYDFTDTSNASSLSSSPISPPQSPVHLPPKKEKKSPESKKSSDSPKKNKSKDKQKKKTGKESKNKSPSPYSPPKCQKQFVLKGDDRTPSPPPTLKDDLLSSDASTPSSSPPHNVFLEHSPQQGHVPPPSLLSHMPSPLSSFIPMTNPASGYSTNPFTPMRSLPCHMQSHFPTPPLFVTPKAESGASFQNMQPLNLAKSGPSSLKTSPDKSFEMAIKTENLDLIKRATDKVLTEKMSKSKDKKEKNKKKVKKEGEKIKKEKEEGKEKEKSKIKDKPKVKAEKNTKVDKRKSKPEKKKIKEKEEKIKEDNSVPKITMKLSSGTGSAKIFVKPNTKNSTPLSSSPSPSNEEDNVIPSPPSSRVSSPSPVHVQAAPLPPPPLSPSMSPSPSPPPPPVKQEPKEITPPPPMVLSPSPVSKATSSGRGRGRGKKAAVQAKTTLITETVGTIVDESGNKIWICPACSGADDGSPMIGCDECDDWYHWVCVGIVVPPKEEEEWFCVRCISKRQTPAVKRRRKKHKKEK